MRQEQVREHFARQADEYEKLMARIVPQYLEQHHVIYNLLPEDNKSYRVLDLGCGNGILSELVPRKLPRSFIVGFDLTENMLQAFEKKLSHHAGKYELKLGDFRTDPIGNGYDIILAGLTLHHFTWLRKAGFGKVACHWRLYNFAITSAEK